MTTIVVRAVRMYDLVAPRKILELAATGETWNH